MGNKMAWEGTTLASCAVRDPLMSVPAHLSSARLSRSSKFHFSVSISWFCNCVNVYIPRNAGCGNLPFCFRSMIIVQSTTTTPKQ